ncbi:MAG: phosphotransferase [Clostridiales bacterium]|nr:phosphotransferase [Clostridiales bacterium]
MSYNLSNEIRRRKTKTVYKDKDSIIKLFVKNYSKADILNEALILARVEEGCDLNIPKLREVTKIGDRWGLVTEYIEGKNLQEMMDEDPSKMEKYLNIFVDIQLEVLSKSVPLLNQIKDKYTRKLTDTTLIDDSTKYELLQRLDGMKNHTKLCHGDFNPSNVIICPNGKHCIVDWAHATIGNASADAARTFLIFSIEGKEDIAERYLDLFCDKSNISKSNVQRWIPIVAATQMAQGNKKEQEFLRKFIEVFEFE